ncbi:MAG: hypothetical protein JNN24_04490 [Hyphomicrobium zavarzinii]|uniref:hypothetical protein n=1 Tax=Hyphomicrobium zavarzinii TaxID=48292 RepID=UPI001A4C6AE9|nr:hypothetical protein [Hyphomicrobium zavarzinii]MBL8845009.1 hypothetical protein [Hyphomicrobium zavarzinii]HML42853.1 hypothetical protein [Hyphomicrobium zavarzinii]
MGARVIQLAEIRARRSAQTPVVALDSPSELNDRFHFWSGASGRRYVHSVYDLLDCPEVPAANFLLVRRDGSGRRSVLAIGHLTHDAGSLNLAEIRHRGARLGANEVHVHLLAPSAQQRRIVELDLRAGQIDCGANEERFSGTRH